jgi:hypothetical protein
LQAFLAGCVDQRLEQLVLVGVAGRRQQKGALDAAKGLGGACAGDDVELHLASPGGRTAGGL